MPDYKLSNGKYIFVKDNDVQHFLSSEIGQGAEEVQGPIAAEQEFEQEVKTPGINFDDYFKPAKTQDSASVDPAVESESMGSNSADGSLGLEETKNIRYLKFKDGQVVYEDEYLDKFAGTENYPSSFDDYAKKFNTKPLTFDTPEIVLESKKSKELLPDLKNAWKSRKYNKVTKTLDPSYNDVLTELDEEEAVQMFKGIYDGSGIEFEESNSIYDVKNKKELNHSINGTDAVRMKILDKKTGKYIYSKPIELQKGGELAERNDAIINEFIDSNSNNIDIPNWVKNQNKKQLQLEKWRSENLDPQLRIKEKELKENFLDNKNLFKETVKRELIPGPYGAPTTRKTTTIPYEKEIKKQVSLISKKYPNKSKEEIEKLAEQNVRNNLYESSRVDFIYAQNENYLSESNNAKKSQGLLYSSLLSKTNKEAKKFNEESKKAQISEENFYQASNDLKTVISYYSNPNEEITSTVQDMYKKYNVDFVDPSNETLDDDFNSDFGIPKGKKINTNLYNILKTINNSAKSSKEVVSSSSEKMDDAIDKMGDTDVAKSAAAKNYNLLEKYATNTALGFQDIAVGTAFLAGSILTAGQSDSLKKAGVDYIKHTNKIRDSYVRDVSFDDAFSSAGNTGKFIAQELSNQIPILVALAATGGAGGYVLGASSAGKQMMDMQYEIATGSADYSEAEVWLKSVGYGVAEGAFSQLTTVRALRRAKSRWTSYGKEQIVNNSSKQFFKSKTPDLIYEPLLEAGGEVLTTGSQNLLLGKPFTENMDHSGVSGFGFGLLFSAVPFMKGAYNSRFSTYDQLSEVRKTQKELIDLQKRFETSQSPVNSKSNQAIIDLINKKREKINDVVQKQENLISNNLTSGGAEKIIKITEEQASLQSDFEEVSQDSSLDEDTKDKILTNLRNQFDQLVKIKEKALSKGVLEANETDWEAFKGLNRSKAQQYSTEAEAILKAERDGRNVEPSAVNRKAYDLYYGDIVRETNSKVGKSGIFSKFTSYETVEDAISSLQFRDDIPLKKKQEIIDGLKKGNDGYADPVTREQVAVVENQVKNQRRYTKVHEVGHEVFWKLLGRDVDSKSMKGVASQLLLTMKKIDRKLYNKFIQDGIDDDSGNIIPSEVVSRFLEYVAENKITNVEKAKGIAGLFGVMVQKQYAKDYDFDFRGKNDIFNFVVGIGNKIKSGELTLSDISQARKAGIKTKTETLAPEGKFLETESSTFFSKSVEDIQSEIVALEDLYDEQRMDYYEYEGKMDVLEAELEEAKKAPKEKPKTTKAVAKVNVSDIEEQIDALNNDFYDGVIDDIEHEQKLDILEAKLKQAKLQVSKPKEAKKQQEKTVKDSVEKFKKEVSEETISDRNKNIAKTNEDIANEMLELGANKISDIKDPVKQKEIIDKLGKNNLGAVTNLTKKATAAGKDLAIDDNLKVGYDEFFSGFSEELSALINSYKVEVDGKKVPFGAYMNKNLPLRYGQILDKALKGRIEGSKSLDINSGEKGFAGTIATEGSADFDAVSSADRGLPAGELIDVTTFGKVKDKVEDIKESIDLKDIDVADLTYRRIQDDYSGEVGADIVGLWDKNAKPKEGQDRNDFQKLAERIEGTRTLNYGKDTGGEAEVRAMQGLFLDYNDAVKFIKTIPEFNVAPFETTIDKQGRSIDLTEDARGYSTGISNKLLKKFYEPYIDPKATSKDKDVKKTAITSPSGRGKGKTSQVAKVYRLKPEYRGKISRQTVQELQKTIGITPAGEAFIPMKGPNRTEFGTALQGLTKMYATNVANTVIRKKIIDEGITSETKSTEKVLADIGGGKSRVMFSKKKQIETALKYITNTEELFSRFNTEEALKGSDKDFNKFKAVFKADVKEFLKYIPSGYRPSNFVGIYSTDIIYKNLSDKEKTIFKNRVAELQGIAKQEMANNNGQPIGFNSPANEMGSTLPQVKETFERKNIKEKIIKKNKKYEKAFDDMWLGIYEAVKNNPNLIPIASLFIEGAAYDVSHPHRRGANFIGYQTNVSPQKNYKGLYRTFEYEHAVQSNIMASELYEAMLNLKDVRQFKEFLNISKMDYKMIALGVLDNKKLEKAGYRFKMPKNWNNWWDRYLNEEVAKIDGGIDPKSIMVLNSKNQLVTLYELAGNVDSSGRKVLFSKGRLDTEFNKIIENKTGILASDNISEVKAKMMADKKRKINFFIPPSAEDFVGLLYATLGKGKVGDKQMKFYDRTLIKPYARAMQAITKDRLDLGRAFKNTRKEFKATPKDLKKKVPNSLFTKEQAVRIYIWDSIGKEVPGLNVEEVNELANYVADNKQLKDFADQVIRLNPGSKYISPKDTWVTGNITTDLLETLNTSRRAKHLGRWQQNVDEIFSTENLNKLEAAYGTKYRKAMENMLTRMKTGRNRTYGTDTQTGKWIEWMNGSVGSIMFLNSRSAVLQTLSSANFINFGDNNIIAAGKAFANQKQYWTDFAKLINSDYLLERRDSLKINVNEADIAEAASKKGARGAINYILKLGFTPTKFADSFAIASGGAAFYRNRINALIKKGMDPVAAEKAAMRDFIEKSEESQQSSRPDKISQEQAGPLGRVVLAFANTPAQYARIIKKSASDLKNRRGSDKENISKILYYSVAQNLLFNALQQAIFAVAFGDEEEDEDILDDKKLNIVNGMLDGIIRGTGVAGAVFSVVKNVGLKIYKESEKKNPKYENMVFEAMKISPPISSKVSKIRSAGRTLSWDMKEIKAKGLDITSPAIGAGAKIISATTNLPLDRVIRKIENLKATSDSELETYKRLALALGWGKWELDIKDKKWKDPNAKPKSKSKVRKRKVKKVVRR